MTFLILNYFLENNLLNSFNLTSLLFSNVIVMNSIFSFYAKNPIFSLIFLIVNYISASILMLLYGLQFLAFVFLLVYVGAISILLLFTLMILNLKIIFYKNFNFKYFFFFLIFILLAEFIIFFYNSYFTLFYYANINSIDWFSIIFFKNEINNFGIELFIYNKDIIFLSAIFLFVVLISSINIILSVKYSKKQLLNIQLKDLNKNIKK